MANLGTQGGSSNPILSNATFTGNRASNAGGALVNANQGGFGISNLALINVTFSDNFAVNGSAMWNYNGSNPDLRNVIAWGDVAIQGSEIFNQASTPTIDHSVIQDGCVTGDRNICANVIATGPLLGALANNGGSTQTMLPAAGSSAIDTGDDSVCASAPVNRVQRGVSRPQGPHCDIGSVEAVSDEIFKNGFDS